MLRTRLRHVAIAFATLGACSLVRPAYGEVLFRGDLETGDLKQWDYLLKEEGLSVVTDPVAQGKYAAKITISKNELWTNGLNRVEVQHQPKSAHVAEGSEVYYGFSFYLPEKLTEDNHQILYWETKETYQQVMQLAVEGESMRFATQKPSWKVHWEAAGKATAGKWHRVVLHVKWSTSADAGQVDLWFDGEQVVTAGKAQTYLGNPAFVQHGILRETIEKVETLYFDDARAGTTLADVLMPAAMGGGGTGGAASGGTASGGTANGGTANGGTASGGTASGGTASGGTASGGMANGGTATGEVGGTPSSSGTASGGTPPATGGATSSNAAPADGSGCVFSPGPAHGTSNMALLVGLVGLVALRRRR